MIYVNPQVFATRPCEKRSLVENEIYDVLEKLHIDYERVDHNAAMTIEDCAEVDALLAVSMCKNLFLCNRQETDFYFLMLPGYKKFKTSILSARLGLSRLSFADGKYMEQYLRTSPGSLSVLGLFYDRDRRVTLCIDSELMGCEYLGCHPCVNTTSLKIKTTDLLDVFLGYTGHSPQIVTLDG